MHTVYIAIDVDGQTNQPLKLPSDFTVGCESEVLASVNPAIGQVGIALNPKMTVAPGVRPEPFTLMVAPTGPEVGLLDASIGCKDVCAWADAVLLPSISKANNPIAKQSTSIVPVDTILSIFSFVFIFCFL